MTIPKKAHPYGFIGIISTVIFIHLILIQLPSINLEWAFSNVVLFFETHQAALLESYFIMQANTLGIPYLAWIIHPLLPFIDLELLPRFVSLFGLVILGAALIRLNQILGNKANPYVLLIVVFLNPLIWVFSGRGTADFFPAALAIFSLSLFLEDKRSTSHLILAILTLGIAVTLKYHAILLLPLIAMTQFSTPSTTGFFQRSIKIALITIAILILPIMYLIMVKESFGFWLTPPTFQRAHKLEFSINFVITNFISYAGYLALLLAPFSMITIWQHIKTKTELIKMFIAAVLLFLIGFYAIKPTGEMNFGPLDAYLHAGVISGMFCIFAAILLLTLKNGVDHYRDNKEAHRKLLCCALGVLIFIGILSFTRPAQRYLLFVLPFLYLFIPQLLQKEKILTWMTLGIYIALNIFVTLSQMATGNAAMHLTRMIEEKGFINETAPGAIISHTGNHFPIDALTGESPKKYTVIAGTHPKQLFFADSHPAPFIHKTYAIVPTKALEP